MNYKISVTELNEILLNSMPNRRSKQAYVQGFYCESITFKKAVDRFEHVEIAESIYEGVVEPSYKKPTREDANLSCHSRNKITANSLSNNHPEMGEIHEKRRKRYVYFPTGESKTCIIHGHGHSSNECKVLGDFDAK